MNGRRTHVNLVREGVIYDFQEADYVGMVDLLHDGNLLAYLVLGAAELVGERQVWIAGKVVVSSKLLEPVALVLPPYCFHGLHASQRTTWVYSLTSEREINGERRREGTDDLLLLLLVEGVDCEIDLAVLALADLGLEEVLVDHLDAVGARAAFLPDLMGHDDGLGGVVLAEVQAGAGLRGPVAGGGGDGVGHV